MRTIYEDFIVGFAVGQVTAFVIGIWSLFLGVLTGILWVAGGQGWLETKLWRRLGVPLLICLPWVLKTSFIWVVASFFMQFGVQCIGYGVPSTQPFDLGSWLGQRFGNWTRAIWFVLLGLAMIPLFL